MDFRMGQPLDPGLPGGEIRNEVWLEVRYRPVSGVCVNSQVPAQVTSVGAGLKRMYRITAFSDWEQELRIGRKIYGYCGLYEEIEFE
jgi:hypothetical protein